MQLGQLLDILDYAQSPNYRSIDVRHDPSTEHLFRAAQKAGVKGSYVFHTSPNDEVLPVRPAVHVAEAQTPKQARQIHRKLWNLGNVPFLIVLLPNQIRVYTGFDYSQRQPQKGLIDTIDNPNLAEIKNIKAKLDYLAAESIDLGKVWKVQADNLVPERRVDTHLLNNLEKLGERLVQEGIDLAIAHALIGKYVYIRYLRDRKIISDEWLEENNLVLDNVLSRNATLAGLRSIIEILEQRFKGDIFPLPLRGKDAPTDDLVSLVASVFKGDDPISGQLHLDFDAYDFSYIPVETLSSIYEQFLRTQGKGKKIGAVYTPEPLADYLLCELNHTKPLERGMKILDPCCGSGIFLVLAYRRLIEIELAKSSNGNLRPTELRDILLESLYGVERNKEACYVAEFSLILTMLNYIDPPDLHRNKDFRFPFLHNDRIFECDFFDDNSRFWKNNEKFDWIIGNPPWIELKPETMGEELARSWITRNYTEKPVTGNKVCEAFSWRVTDLLKPEGNVGLLIHAKSLFNHESEKYRKGFFKQNEVTRITNFSNLAYVLFGSRGEAPAATLLYNKANCDQEKRYITHYAPFVVNQISNRPWKADTKNSTWSITINENEIQTVSHDDAETGEAMVWKLALWGSYRDKRAIKRLAGLFKTTLGEIIQEKGWIIHEGLKLSDGKIDPEIQGKKCLNVKAVNQSGWRFAITDDLLQQIPYNKGSITKRHGRAPLKVASPPHIVIDDSYNIYSDKEFIIPAPQVGIAGSDDDADYLRAVSIFLNSSISQYYLFFQSPSWGVDRTAVYPKDIKKIPFPIVSQTQIAQLAMLQREFENLESSRIYPKLVLQEKLDSKIETLLKIPKNISIIAQEFIQIRLKLNKGKAVSSATEMPNAKNLLDYGKCLAKELDDFVVDSGVRHKIEIVYSKSLIICMVEIINSDTPIEVTVKKADKAFSSLLSEIRKKSKQQFSQWVYIQRGIRIFGDSKIYICKNSRLIDWTKTQSLNDSDDIIAEVLTLKD